MGKLGRRTLEEEQDAHFETIHLECQAATRVLESGGATGHAESLRTARCDLSWLSPEVRRSDLGSASDRAALRFSWWCPACRGSGFVREGVVHGLRGRCCSCSKGREAARRWARASAEDEWQRVRVRDARVHVRSWRQGGAPVLPEMQPAVSVSSWREFRKVPEAEPLAEILRRMR